MSSDFWQAGQWTEASKLSAEEKRQSNWIPFCVSWSYEERAEVVEPNLAVAGFTAVRTRHQKPGVRLADRAERAERKGFPQHLDPLFVDVDLFKGVLLDWVSSAYRGR